MVCTFKRRPQFFIEGGGVIAWSQCESYRLTLDEEKAKFRDRAGGRAGP